VAHATSKRARMTAQKCTTLPLHIYLLTHRCVHVHVGFDAGKDVGHYHFYGSHRIQESKFPEFKGDHRKTEPWAKMRESISHAREFGGQCLTKKDSLALHKYLGP